MNGRKYSSGKKDDASKDSDSSISLTGETTLQEFFTQLQQNVQQMPFSSTSPPSLIDRPSNTMLRLKELRNASSTTINSTEEQKVPGQNESPPEIDISDETRILPEVATEIRPDLFREEEAAHTLKGLDQDCFSTNENPSASSDTSHSERSSNVCSPIEPRPDRFPVYASQAQILLQSVLKEIIENNDKNDRWAKFASQFLDDSESGARKYGGNLGRGQMYYLAVMNTVWRQINGQNPQRARDMEMAIYTLKTYEILTSAVRAALAHIVAGRLSGNFDGFILNHAILKDLNEAFSDYWKLTEIEVIESEAFRNDLKYFKQMILRNLLASLMASRMFLMYIGENVDESKTATFEMKLQEETVYLRRNS